jgi:hypothetical protein
MSKTVRKLTRSICSTLASADDKKFAKDKVFTSFRAELANGKKTTKDPPELVKGYKVAYAEHGNQIKEGRWEWLVEGTLILKISGMAIDIGLYYKDAVEEKESVEGLLLNVFALVCPEDNEALSIVLSTYDVKPKENPQELLVRVNSVLKKVKTMVDLSKVEPDQILKTIGELCINLQNDPEINKDIAELSKLANTLGVSSKLPGLLSSLQKML